MRIKGKIIKWHESKAFGFIAPNNGDKHVFVHKTALNNRARVPKTGDIITFSMTIDKNGRACAGDAMLGGDKLPKNGYKRTPMLSIYLSVLLLMIVLSAFLADKLHERYVFGYIGLSIITYFAYALDKSKAKRGTWRIQESTLHLLSLLGGWPGAAFAQQYLRHKSAKKPFRIVYWATVIINLVLFVWLVSTAKLV